MQIIEEKELKEWLSAHDEWEMQNDEITVNYKFKDFITAFGFISKVAILAEKHNHHPTIENSYNSVKISMNTHDADNKITNKDLELAEAIESLK